MFKRLRTKIWSGDGRKELIGDEPNSVINGNPRIKLEQGHRCFETEAEAKAAGFRRSKR